MHILIILNAPMPNAARLQQAVSSTDCIIAADGGANRASEAGIRPDVVVGDFDSMDNALRQTWPDTEFVHRPSQYATDFEKALQLAIERGAESAQIVGISGGRFDHQITNLNVMQRFSKQMALTCIDSDGYGHFVHDRLTFQTVPGQQISLAAFQKATGITTSGLKFALSNGILEWGKNDGQSNEALASEVTIELKSGTLFVYALWPQGSDR